jgi:hypothetical protein
LFYFLDLSEGEICAYTREREPGSLRSPWRLRRKKTQSEGILPDYEIEEEKTANKKYPRCLYSFRAADFPPDFGFDMLLITPEKFMPTAEVLKTNTKCECGSEEVRTLFDQSMEYGKLCGLEKIEVDNVEVLKCEICGEEDLVIPAMSKLHIRIAQKLLEAETITSDEYKFVLKILTMKKIRIQSVAQPMTVAWQEQTGSWE